MNSAGKLELKKRNHVVMLLIFLLSFLTSMSVITCPADADALEDAHAEFSLQEETSAYRLCAEQCPVEAKHTDANHMCSYIDLSYDEKSYDLLMQQKVHALLDEPEFSEKVWKSLNKGEKQMFLNDLLARVQEVMGTDISGGIVFSKTNHPKGYYAVYSRAYNCIFFYPNLMKKNDYHFLVSAVFHEARHAYQWESVVDWYQLKWFRESDMSCMTFVDRHGEPISTIYAEKDFAPRHPHTSEYTAMIWRENFSNQVLQAHTDSGSPNVLWKFQYQQYLESPIESDANSFAEQLEPVFVSNSFSCLLTSISIVSPAFPAA